MKKVVIADDHTLFRQGLAELIGGDRELSVVGLASNGEEALSLARTLHPDLLILDITMPGLDGFEVAERIKQEGLPVRVVLLSMHKDAVSARKAEAIGVDGYVLKEEAFDDLLYALKSVAGGKRFFSPGIQAAVSREAGGAGEGGLTGREREVAVAIARGLSTKEIAGALGISVKTVETHRQRIMEKLRCHKATEIAAFAVKAGWLD